MRLAHEAGHTINLCHVSSVTAHFDGAVSVMMPYRVPALPIVSVVRKELADKVEHDLLTGVRAVSLNLKFLIRGSRSETDETGRSGLRRMEIPP